ncbi:MAG: hypothetical protein ABI056_07935, partial [Caulobacteraceae bacterium]
MNSPLSAGDDIVTWLAKAAAWHDLPPRIVTVSRQPVKGLMDVVFGPDATINAIVDPSVSSARAEFFYSGGMAAESLDVDPAHRAIAARFVTADALRAILLSRSRWLAACVAVIVQMALEPGVLAELAALGFTNVRAFGPAGGGPSVLTRPHPVLPDPVPFAPLPQRRLERLVIVDPCLGAGRGHYLAHARMLSAGAHAIGAEVTWACQRALTPEDAPAGTDIRRCFDRCFIDLDMAGETPIDLSAELLSGWLEIADVFDRPGTHLLMHSADGHLLRAAADLLEAKPAFRGAIHLLLHVDPRHLAGRARGEEVHRALVRMRGSPAWSRQLFLWAENRRLGDWLSEWLQAPIPTAPALVSPHALGPPGENGVFVLASLGESRASKGFLDLPAIADAIASDPSLRRTVRLVVQWWPPAGRPLQRHEEAIASLRRHDFVEILEGGLPEPEYRRQLAGADALLFPYDPNLYRMRGSGVLLEALAQGAAILVRAGSALESVAAEGVAFVYRRPGDVPPILHRLLG